MDEAQGAQRLDQVQFARIEFGKVFVAGEDVVQLILLLFTLARQQHPQVLYRRPAAAVVEIDEVRAVVGPQHVAGVAVAVQAQRAHVAGAGVAVRYLIERVIDHAVPRRRKVGRQPVAGTQEVARLRAEAVEVERGPVREGGLPPDRVDAPEKAPHALQRAGAVEFGRPPALFGEYGKAKTGVGVERGPVEPQGCHHRNLTPGELGGVGVFFEDGVVAPACRAVELHHHMGRAKPHRRSRVGRRIPCGYAVFHAHLIDAVFVTVEREQAAVGAQAGTVERVEDKVGRKAGVGGRRFGHGSTRTGKPDYAARRNRFPVAGKTAAAQISGRPRRGRA